MFFFHDKCSTRCRLLKFRSLNTNAGPEQTGSCWISTVVKSTHHHCKSTFSVSIYILQCTYCDLCRPLSVYVVMYHNYTY